MLEDIDNVIGDLKDKNILDTACGFAKKMPEVNTVLEVKPKRRKPKVSQWEIRKEFADK